MTKYKVFIGLREIAGYFSNLKGGFEEAGVESAFLNLGGNPYNYSLGKNPGWVSFFNFIGRRVGTKFSKTFILRFIWLTVFQNIFSLIAFFIAIFNYNVFILGSNSTFFYFLDLPVLKLLNKKVIYVFLGTDSRPLYLNGYVFSESRNLKLIIFLTRIQKTVVSIIERYATVIVNHPPQAYFHEKSFVSSLMIGLPYCDKLISNKKSTNLVDKKDLKIIHVPSKSGPKGSDKFREIINRLKEKYEFQYIEISGIPNNEVIDIICDADIALDEVYSDTPMAVFATECAFQGVPVVVGSYYADLIYADYAKSTIPPSVFVLPENIEKAIEKLIVDADYRKQSGNDAFNFVTHNWSSKVVAEKYLKLISGEIPKEWFYDPYKISYLYGCGLSREQVKENIKLFVDKKGIKSLRLKDKPHLEEQFLELLKK